MTQSEELKPVIAPAEKKDIEDITAIYSQAVLSGTASFELEPPDVTEMLHRWERLSGQGFPYLVARIGGLVAGYGYAGPYHERPGYQWTVEDTVYVNPKFHRMGLGSALLQELIDLCILKGYRQMVAVIGDSENYGSIRLHQQKGFELVGINRAVGLKFDGWLDVVVMQRELGEGCSTLPQAIS